MIKDNFRKLYGEAENKALQILCPARVNMIGEYTDFNGGLVMPAAIDLGIKLVIRKREDREIHLAAWDSPEPQVFSLDDQRTKINHWPDYPLGVLEVLKERGMNPDKGFESYFISTIPRASGLSSSAALEVAFMYAMTKLYNFDLSLKEIAVLSQKAENEYVGVQCGIMDQYAVALGKDEHCLLLDCGAIEHEYIPCELGDYSLVITNTCKKRGLTESKYNDRRFECDTVVEILNKKRPTRYLCELNREELEKYKDMITDPVLLQRFRHAVTENARVQEAAEAMRTGNIEKLGELLNQSHISLRDDFEVSGKQQDVLHKWANEFPDCIGSRMTGAGFGGCHISLVKKGTEEAFKAFLAPHYTEETGITPEFYAVEITDGVRMM